MSVLGEGLSSPAAATSSVSPASGTGRTSTDGTSVHSVHILTSCPQPSALILGLDSRGRVWGPVGTPLVLRPQHLCHLCGGLGTCCWQAAVCRPGRMPGGSGGTPTPSMPAPGHSISPPGRRPSCPPQTELPASDRAARLRPVWAHNGVGGRGSLPAWTAAPGWCVCTLTRSGRGSWHDGP